MILDLGLPELPGLEVLRRTRRFSAVPVIVLSARDRREDKTAALDLGADGYVTKPFDPHELLARMRAALRRRPTAARDSVLSVEGLEVDLARRSVRLHGQPVALTRTGLALLEELAGNPGKLLTHEHLMRRVWGQRGPGISTLRTHIKGLRRKLGDDGAASRLIRNETGVGYRWVPEPPPAGSALSGSPGGPGGSGSSGRTSSAPVGPGRCAGSSE